MSSESPLVVAKKSSVTKPAGSTRLLGKMQESCVVTGKLMDETSPSVRTEAGAEQGGWRREAVAPFLANALPQHQVVVSVECHTPSSGFSWPQRPTNELMRNR